MSDNTSRKKECPSCAMIVDGSSKVCPVCQYEFPTGLSTLQWGALALALLFIIYLIVGVL